MDGEISPQALALRDARLRKGWSQRELSERSGLTQANISRIESGASDLRLSTLVELARLLDLELVLAPRTTLTAVSTVIRETEETQEARAVQGSVNDLQQLVNRLRVERPGEPLVERLANLARQIHIKPEPKLSSFLPELFNVVRDIEASTPRSSSSWPLLARVVERLAIVRSLIVHQSPRTERPAYRLDEEA